MNKPLARSSCFFLSQSIDATSKQCRSDREKQMVSFLTAKCGAVPSVWVSHCPLVCLLVLGCHPSPTGGFVGRDTAAAKVESRLFFESQNQNVCFHTTEGPCGCVLCALGTGGRLRAPGHSYAFLHRTQQQPPHWRKAPALLSLTLCPGHSTPPSVPLLMCHLAGHADLMGCSRPEPQCRG